MKIINIGILAHVDAGKTTLTESLLYTSGAIEAPGSVDQGTTRTDTMFLERQRGITIQTAVTSFQWHDCKVNIVDTPGHMDFLAEVYRSLAILDGAILVVSAKDGVQAQTRILFHALQVMKIPTVIFINKIDQDGIDLPGVYQSIRDKLSANMIIKQNVQLSPDISIMENMGLENWDTVIADCDELLEKYIAGEPMDKEELLREENRRIQSVSLFPVYHGSAKVRSILNLAHKDAGTIKIFGLDTVKHEQEIKDRIGIVMDGSYFYNELSMQDMKSIIAPAYSKWSDADYRSYMEKFELDPKQKISTLSKGMRMKFALVLALSHQAELLIMDEPTSGLDPLVRSQFLGIVMDYMENGGKGVFFSTHITSDLDKIADMLVLIDGGKIVFQQSKDDLLDTFRVVKGNAALLNDQNKKLIRSLKVSSFGFTGITDQAAEVKKEMPDVLLEKASIEDIMLAYIGGDNDDR